MSASLTERQNQIADMLKDGDSPKQIASKLKLSVHTVNAHIQNMAAKLPGKDPPLRRVLRWKLTIAGAPA